MEPLSTGVIPERVPGGYSIPMETFQETSEIIVLADIDFCST